MAVRTKQLALVKSTVGTQLIYTASSGETTIVKEAALYNGHSSSQTLTLSVVNAASTVEVFVRQAISVPAFQPVVFSLWLAMMAGDKLYLYQAAGSDARALISGTELEGVAD